MCCAWQLRVFKTEEELAVLRYVTEITCQAHMEVMRQCRPGLREYQMESLFQHYVYEKGGCRTASAYASPLSSFPERVFGNLWK